MTWLLPALTILGLIGTVTFFIVFAAMLWSFGKEGEGRPPARLDETSRALVHGARRAFFTGFAILFVMTVTGQMY